MAPSRSAGLPEGRGNAMEFPRQLGFRMPAEWAPHEATWIAWPHEESDWPGKFEAIQWVYGEIVRHLARVEQVSILVEDEEEEEDAREILRVCHADAARVRFFHIRTDRSWTRDFCPTFLKREKADLTSAYADVQLPAELAVLDWRFNGWAKYDNWEHDDRVAASVAATLKLAEWSPMWKGERVVLEGGAIDVNGRGTILTTEECLLSPIQARNPSYSKEDYEAIFANFLRAKNTLWLRNGIAGDDTHGHVDDLARFVDSSTVVAVEERDTTEVNYAPLEENLALLKEMKDQDGAPLRIVTLPMPEPVFFDNQRLPASYANFYIANRLVLVPTFNDKNDRVALDKLAGLFPGRTVVGIAATDLVLGLGTLHCMTQQQPAL
jgi:agmatine deiminase